MDLHEFHIQSSSFSSICSHYERLLEILLVSSRPTLRAQDDRSLMNSTDCYSKFIAPHRDTTELIELRQETEFVLLKH